MRLAEGRRDSVVDLASVRLLDYLTATADTTAPRLVLPRVKSAVELDRRSAGVLVATFLKYVELHLNVTATAEALHVHQNTVYYRLSRLASDTGLDPRLFTDVVELLLSLKLISARAWPVEG